MAARVPRLLLEASFHVDVGLRFRNNNTGDWRADGGVYLAPWNALAQGLEHALVSVNTGKGRGYSSWGAGLLIVGRIDIFTTSGREGG